MEPESLHSERVTPWPFNILAMECQELISLPRASYEIGLKLIAPTLQGSGEDSVIKYIGFLLLYACFSLQ